MEKALAIQEEVQRILGTEEVYLVGGSVRDLVMGNEPKDYDFTTPMLPEDITEKVKAAGRRVYTIGEKFGTIGFKVLVDAENHFNVPKDSVKRKEIGQHVADPAIIKLAPQYEYVEVTTFRSEVYTNKSRKPEVKFVPSLDEDLARRDFTMNAMVLKGDGKIYDPYGGRLDIHAKQIKAVGMPKDRIQEDPLRMLRAARFAARYDFTIDPNFIGKARQLADRIYDVSIERWVQELDKLFTSTYESAGTRSLDQMCLLQRILPEFYSEFDANFPHAKADQKVYESADLAWRDLLRTINENPKTARYMAAGICARMKFSNDRMKIILGQVSTETMDK